jgi:hypothetical protein
MSDIVAGDIYVALDSSDIHVQWQGVDCTAVRRCDRVIRLPLHRV